MPRVSTLAEFRHTVAGFDVEDLPIDIEPAALRAAHNSITTSGLLMVGEVHGGRRCRADVSWRPAMPPIPPCRRPPTVCRWGPAWPAPGRDCARSPSVAANHLGVILILMWS